MPMDRLTRASLGPVPAGSAARPGAARDAARACRTGTVGLPASMADMNAISLLVGLLLGVALGAAIGYLLARGRLAGLTADLTGQARAADERATRGRSSGLALVERAAQEQAALIDGQLAERFQALSAQALDQQHADASWRWPRAGWSAANAKAAGELDTRKAAVEHLVQPLRETLARVESQLRETDAARRQSHAALTEQVIDRPAELRPAARPDPGPGHRAAAARGPRPVGRDAAAPGGRAGRA